MRYPFLALIGILTATFSARDARAQIEQARAVIAGRVTIAGDTLPMKDAEVFIVGSRERQTTNSRGEFRFTGIYPGRYEVRVRRLGYEQLVKFVTVGGGEISKNNWEMRFLPQQLAEVRVQGRLVQVPPFLKDAYRRAAWGFGDFLLPDDIARRNAFQTADLLDMVPGAHVSKGDVEFARCDSNQDPFGAASGSRPKIQVYIDGHLMTHMNSVASALEMVTPKDIDLIEVYRGVARIPVEFLANACAVIAIWTKRG
jgi:hypothetical protein